MHRRGIMAGVAGFVGLATAAAVWSLWTHPNSRVEAKLVGDEKAGTGGDRRITVELRRGDADGLVAFDLVGVQYRLAGRWLEAEGFPQLNESRLFVYGSRQRVVFTVPGHSEACRFELAYMSVKRGYIFFQRRGWWSPLQVFWRRVLNFRPSDLWLGHSATLELK